MLRLTDAFNQLVLGRSKAQRLVQALAIGTLTRVPRAGGFMAGRLSQIGIDYPRARAAITAWSASACPTSTAAAPGCTNYCATAGS